MRFAAGIEYEGTHYHGWQRQPNTELTIQQKVEEALSHVADHPVTIFCAGRTDAGVHAYEQIIHFDTEATRTERAWVFGANTFLPKDISVRWVRPVMDTFHARFDAIARRYHYFIFNHPIRSALKRHHATWYCLPLDVDRMQVAANTLIGTHDFTSFRAQSCQAKSPIRTIEELSIRRDGDLICIDIKANAFLHHMVRNIAGVLMAIGANKEPIEWTEALLTACSREAGGVTALPNGLHFVKAYYPFGTI